MRSVTTCLTFSHKKAPTLQISNKLQYRRMAAKMKAIRIHTTGGTEVLKYEEVDVPVPKDNEVLVKQHAIGLNYIDTYYRSGLYKGITFPHILGREGAGVVQSIGKDVTSVKVGDRVAYGLVEGTYAEYVSVTAWKAVKIPDAVNYDIACAAMIQGLTAHFLSSSTYPLKPGDTALVLAGAGGVGQLLIQIAKLRGARVITTVSTPDKAKIVKELGADEVILYTEAKIDEEVRKLTNNKGVQVAYDSVGASTYMQSLKSLAPLGYLVLYGNSSGPVPPFDPLMLSANGSLFVTRPTMGHYCATPEALNARADDIFKWIAEGKLKVSVAQKFPLSQAAEAHRQLEGRKTTGKTVLIPEN